MVGVCHPWDGETKERFQKWCPSWPKQSISLLLATPSPVSCLERNLNFPIFLSRKRMIVSS